MTEDEMVWMTSLTQWTWVWANSGKRWGTVKSGMLQSMGSQRVGHNCMTEQKPTKLLLHWGQETLGSSLCFKIEIGQQETKKVYQPAQKSKIKHILRRKMEPGLSNTVEWALLKEATRLGIWELESSEMIFGAMVENKPFWKELRSQAAVRDLAKWACDDF